MAVTSRRNISKEMGGGGGGGGGIEKKMNTAVYPLDFSSCLLKFEI